MPKPVPYVAYDDTSCASPIEHARAAKAAKRVTQPGLKPREIFDSLAPNKLAWAHAAVQLYEQGRFVDTLELLALGAPRDRVVRRAAIADPWLCDEMNDAASTISRMAYAKDPVAWRKRMEPERPVIRETSAKEFEEFLAELVRQTNSH